MNIKDLRIFYKYLSRNKLYTLVSIFGFSISLMFVILLTVYAKNEYSVDDFHKKKDRIYLLTSGSSSNFANPVADFVMDKCPDLESFTRVLHRSVKVKKDNSKIRTEALFADSTFFNIFSFELLEGSPSQVLKLPHSAVITQSYALKTFGSKNPVGLTLSIDDQEFSITGLCKDFPSTASLGSCDIILDYATAKNYWGNEILTNWGNSSFTIFFLAKEGSDIHQKESYLLETFKKDYWLYKDGFVDSVIFTPLKDIYFKDLNYGCINLKNNSKSLVSIYTGIAILILVISILNYVNMTVAQAGFRGKEVAIKKLMGADRNRIIILLLKESLLIMTITFLIGLILAFVTESFFNNALTTNLHLREQFTPFVIGLSIVFIIAISIISGLLPAIIISRFKPIEVIKGSFSRKMKSRYSNILIGFQYTIAISLLICSFFIKQQSEFLINHETGFNRNRILLMDNVLDTIQIGGFKNNLLAIPGVEKVSYSQGTPTSAGNNHSFEKDGETFSFQEFFIDSVFFDIYGIKVQPTGVQTTWAKQFWINKKGYNALHVNTETNVALLGNSFSKEVTGIIGDLNIRSLHLSSDLIYMRPLLSGDKPWNISVKIAENANLSATTDLITKAYSQYDNSEILEIEFVDSVIKQWYDKEQKMTFIMNAFTVLTIIIMTMGVFAMSQYSIRQKEKEIGIRKVNGATIAEILIMLNKSSLAGVLIACLIAFPISYYAITKWLENFAYKIDISWWVFASAGCIVLLLRFIAISGMTWKAAKANPVDSLKGE